MDPYLEWEYLERRTRLLNLVHYERLLDYTALPPPPDLTPDELAWVEAILQQAGRRPAPGGAA
jgi:hypothetical protein